MIIALASSNRGKVRELERLLPDWVEVKTAIELGLELPEETGITFLENALLKARAAAKQTNMISVADDSGLEVDALQGAPGVRSARFAGEPPSDQANNDLLLRMLANVEPKRRTARFRSVVAAVSPDGTQFHDDGVVEGTIVNEPRGANGFGYDPLFQPAGFERTFAELSLDEKNEISHRGKALRRIAARLIPYLEAYHTNGTAGTEHPG